MVQGSGRQHPQHRERVGGPGGFFLPIEAGQETARALRDEVARLGGRVIGKQVDGAASSWRAQIRLRLLPARLVDVMSWIEKHGDRAR